MLQSNWVKLIIKADSLLGDAYMERVDIVRTRSDFKEELIKLNLSKALNGDLQHNIVLQGLDKIRVYGMTEMVTKKYVSISGHVKNSGMYELQQGMTYDLVFKAGGYVDKEFINKAHLDFYDLMHLMRAILHKKSSLLI